MKTKLSLLALALCSTSVLADSWLYAGGQVGQSDIDGESDSVSSFTGNVTFHCL